MTLRAAANLALCAAGFAYLAYAAYMEFGGGAPESTRTVIAMLGAGSREQKAAYEQVIAAFERSHSDLQVRLEWGASGDFFGVLMTRMAGGVPPDVMFMYEFKLPYFARKRTLLDLTPYVQREFQAELADFHPQALKIFTLDQKLYAMPVTLAPVVLFYNKRLFDEAGLGYPDATWTWETLRAVALQLTRRDERGRVTCYGLANNLHFEMVEMLTGKRRLGADLSTHFTDPEIVEAIAFNTNLILQDRVAPDSTATKEQSVASFFENGKAAMTIIGRWMVPTYNRIADLEYDVAPLPLWKNRQRATYTHAVGYAIAAESKHQAASWEFVKYLGSREALALLTQLGDTVPARLSVLRSPIFLTPEERPAHDRVFADALDYSAFIQVVDPPLPNYYREAIEALLVEPLTPAEAMQRVKRETDRWIAENHPRLLR